MARAALSASCARLRISGTVRAWRGAVTPPMVTVTATGPALVSIGSSRTAASSRSAATDNSSGVQVFRMTPNLLPEKRPSRSSPRSFGLHAFGKLGDHLLGDVEAIGFVEPAEMVDGDEQETAGGAETHGLIEDAAEHFDQMRAVHLAGQRVELRQLYELALALVPLVDGAHDAMGTLRLAVGPGEPAAGILDPDFFAVGAAEGVFDLIGNAGAGIVLGAAGDRVETALPVRRLARAARRRGRRRSRPSLRRRARPRRCRSRRACRCRGAIRRRPRRRRRESWRRPVNRALGRYGSRSPLFGNAARHAGVEGQGEWQAASYRESLKN